jgi:hypothetical protein
MVQNDFVNWTVSVVRSAFWNFSILNSYAELWEPDVSVSWVNSGGSTKYVCLHHKAFPGAMGDAQLQDQVPWRSSLKESCSPSSLATGRYQTRNRLSVTVCHVKGNSFWQDSTHLIELKKMNKAISLIALRVRICMQPNWSTSVPLGIKINLYWRYE